MLIANDPFRVKTDRRVIILVYSPRLELVFDFRFFYPKWESRVVSEEDETRWDGVEAVKEEDEDEEDDDDDGGGHTEVAYAH